jgi:hypothetical protein
MIELKINAASTEDLTAQILALAAHLGGAPVEAPAQPPVEDKPKAVAAKPAKAAPKKAEPDPAPDATVAAKAPKLLDFNTEVAPHVVATVESHGKELVASVLTQYGVARASEIDPAQWPEFLVSLEDAKVAA